MTSLSTITDDEKKRYVIISYMFECAAKLRLSIVTTASAAVIYHKCSSYLEKTDFDQYTLAATALSLASKYEEEHVKIRDLINVTYRTLYPDRPYLRISNEYYRLRNTLVDCELFLIRILGFHFQFNHPNKYLLHYLDTLTKWMMITPSTPIKNNINLIDIAMSILQDTYYDFTLIKDYSPQHIAIVIIYLLIKTYNLEIPGVTNDDEHINWMKVFSSSMTNDILIEIITRINTVYKYVERTLEHSSSIKSH
ncbi:unnamed protein product [Adineta steineri]|uniref:Cyclin-like domain-containing protein n=1 Tax=Adineta steineri TaxID=433720 RepID=A0A814TYC7_9BILA|nr:unnamed protein product [Adineta steineri]CAF1164477.1 unnamed protein product [Adineta steineri]